MSEHSCTSSDEEEKISLMPRNTSEYSKQEYWDWRYKQETQSGEERHYDWILEYPRLKPFFEPYLKHSDKILMVGCGNSKLSEDLYLDGFTKIHNVDYSAGVIELMSAKTCESCPEMTWDVKDMRNMDGIPDDCYDVVLDKCALDAIWTDGGSVWEPRDETVKDITDSLKEFHRVLKPNGIFLFVSFGQPHFRKPLLATIGWDIVTVEIGMFFMYVMKKSS